MSEDMLSAFLLILETEIEMKSGKSSILKTAALLLALVMIAAFAASCAKPDEESGTKEKEYKPSFKIGEKFKFGEYEQDNNEENGKEPIEWIVVGKDGKKALILSVKGLDSIPFKDAPDGDASWDSSDVRAWLNDVFYANAFSDEERNHIVKTTVPADKNPEYDTEPGTATEDAVFLLSIAEVEKYIESDDVRKCQPTAYAVAKGVWSAGAKGNCWWLLRTPGSDRNKVADVNVYGSVRTAGEYAQTTVDAVRPAFWIDMNEFPTPTPEPTKAPTKAPSSTPAP